MNALGGDFLSRLLEKDAEFKGIYEAHRSYEKKRHAGPGAVH